MAASREELCGESPQWTAEGATGPETLRHMNHSI
jgi:hypothetical protein